MKRLAAALFSLSALSLIATVASAQNYNATYFFSNTGVWVVQVTSYYTQAMNCSVAWSAVKVGSTALGQQIGPVNGSFTMYVPAYSGRGPAVVAQQSVPGVGNFQANINCN